jgi:hypothetical protein
VKAIFPKHAKTTRPDGLSGYRPVKKALTAPNGNSLGITAFQLENNVRFAKPIDYVYFT